MDVFQGKRLVDKDGVQVDPIVALENKLVGLFFSAGWCPPCRRFLPLLVEFYQMLTDRDAHFEIVFISSDATVRDMDDYRRCHGNWLSLSHSDALVKQLKQRYSVWTIPKLIVIAPDGEIMTTRGRAEVTEMGVDCFDVWLKSSVQSRLFDNNDSGEADKSVGFESSFKSVIIDDTHR